MKQKKKRPQKNKKKLHSCGTYPSLRLHCLPAGTHLLHLRREEWTLAGLHKDSRIQNLLYNGILQMSQKTT